MQDAGGRTRAAVMRAALLFAAVGLTGAQAAPDDAPAPDWARMASAQALSPARAAPGDLVREWTGPDGRPVRLVVRLPQPRAGELSVSPPPAGQDARPVLEAALDELRRRGLGRLRLQPGSYVFRSTAQGGHWLLQGLQDVDIDARGARLVFSADAPGIVLGTSQRVRLRGATLAYQLPTSALAVLRERDGRRELVLDDGVPVDDTTRLFYLTEYDRASRLWVKGGTRLILPPGAAAPLQRVQGQVFSSSALASLRPGASYAVFRQWYGGAAFKIDDQPGPQQAEDIVLQDVTVLNAPGMGFLVYGLKRGFALLGSRVQPEPGSAMPVSSNFDALHIQSGGGDLLIADNHFVAQGDDGINLNNPVHPVVRIEDEGRSLVLSTYSRFIRSGDRLAFFGGDGRLLGLADVTAPPEPLGGLEHRVRLSRAIEGLDTRSAVRDLALLASRYLVERNTVERCHCHGLLAQLPNGLIRGNTFSQLSYNAIRLLTDVGPWREGVGAINVAVLDNDIRDTGPDQAPAMPWAAIAAYGTGRGGVVVDEPVNQFLDIRGNRIQRVQQGCITVASSRTVTVADNECSASNLNKRRADSLSVQQASQVTLRRNRLDGATRVDRASAATVDAAGER